MVLSLLQDSSVYKRLLVSIVVLAIALFLVPKAHAANRYWVGAANDRFEKSSNWSTMTRGAGGASVPTSSDVAIFTYSGGTVRLRSAVSVAGILFASNWTGSLLQGTGTLAIGSTGLRMGSGTLVGSNVAITDAGVLTQTGGIIRSLQSTLSMSGSFAKSGTSTFTSTGTMIFSGASNQTVTLGSASFKNLTIRNTGGTNSTNNVTVTGNLTLGGNLTITQGKLDLGTNDSALALVGDLNIANSALAVLTTDQNINSSGSIIVKPSGTLTITSNTTTLNGSSQTLSGALTFYSLTKTPSAADTLTIGASSVLTMNGVTNIMGSSAGNLTVVSGTSGTQWHIVPSASASFSYLTLSDSANNYSDILQCTHCSDAGGNTRWEFPVAASTTTTTTTSSSTSSGGGGGGGGGGRRSTTSTTTVAPKTTTVTTPSKTTISPARLAAKLKMQQRIAERKAKAARAAKKK